MQDMKAYKQEFVTEASEFIETLNNDLVELEKSPSPELINKLFRTFHTLKGNAGAMGYQNYSEVAHNLEDILDKIRNGKLMPEGSVMAILFKGCDILSDGLEAIEESGEDNVDATEIISEVKSILGTEKQAISKVTEYASLSMDENAKIVHGREIGKTAHRIIVMFDKSNAMKIAKAAIILRNIENYEIVRTIPSSSELSKMGDEFEIVVLLEAEADKEMIIASIRQISGVIDVLDLSIDAGFKRDDNREAQAHDKISNDIEKHKIAETHKEDTKAQIRTVKLDIKRLDKLMNLVGELLINKMRLAQISKKFRSEEFQRIIKLIDRITEDLQSEVMESRMIPIGMIINRFPRMVRDLADKENKKVNLVIEGEEIEFDRNILEELSEPLVHLLRNCVDHGIESDRTGKPETGTIKIAASREKSHAIIEVSDDGAGIDPQIVKQTCIKKGIISKEDADKLSDYECQMLIFRPGASTNEIITEVSGRGVGMNVVETKIRSLGGTLKLNSTVGKGTTVTMKLPLTLSIVACMLTEVCGTVYAIPLSSVNRIVKLKKSSIKTIQGKQAFNFMGKEIAVVSLREVFFLDHADAEEYIALVVDKGDELVGIIVDKVFSQEQILIKKLDHAPKGIAGSTILGDGSVGLVIDAVGLFQ
ncbi:MAG: chemotaxis protein CheA [archaeon]